VCAERRSWKPTQEEIRDVEYDLVGSLVAMVSEDNKCKLWNPRTGTAEAEETLEESE
jgi:hypothetical protein